MIVWLDAQLSPALAPWIESTFGVESYALRDLGLREATDEEIFQAAKAAGAALMTKDSDFVKMHHLRGAPPQIIWLTCGNTSNNYLSESPHDSLSSYSEATPRWRGPCGNNRIMK